MQPHRSNALRYASAARDAHSRVYGGCAAEAAVSEASGPRVSGCIRAPRHFNPNPVDRGAARRSHSQQELPIPHAGRSWTVVCGYQILAPTPERLHEVCRSDLLHRLN